jgi:hypothetical protein
MTAMFSYLPEQEASRRDDTVGKVHSTSHSHWRRP